MSDDGTHIIGSGTANLTVTNLLDTDSGYYYVLINNNYGSVTSRLSGALQVYSEPFITAQNPSGSFNLYPNQNLTLSLSAVGAAPLTYQWYTNGAADTSAGTTSSYALANVQTAMLGYTYQCIVGNSFGSATGALHTLTVLSLPANIANSPYATNVLSLGAAGYWPMHEIASATPAFVETNYGTLGALGDGYYNDWASPIASHQTSGAIAGDSDPGITFYNNVADTLVVPHTSPLSTIKAPFSLEAWIKPFTDNHNSGGSYMVVMGQGNVASGNGNSGGFALQYSGTPQTFSLVIWNGNGGGAYEQKTTAAYPPGVWYHLVGTFDGTNVAYYVNGQQATFGTLQSGTPGPMNPDSWSPFVVGAGRWGGNGPAQPFIGQMDEVAVYTNLLTSQQIQSHYSAGTTVGGNYFQTITGDSPLLYYRMDAPAYTPPPGNTQPVLTNYGTTALNGVYAAGTAAGSAAGPSESGVPVAELSGTNAMRGNGAVTYADAGNAPAFIPPPVNSQFSYSAWFRGHPADARSFQCIMSANDNSWRCLINGTGKVQAHGSGSDTVSPIAYNDGNWHHLVLTCVETNTTTHAQNTNILYIDGLQVGISSGGNTNNPFVNPTPEVLLGEETGFTNTVLNANWNGGRSFAGDICEAAFFPGVVLSSNQVRTLYDSAAVAPFITQQPLSATNNQNTAFTNTVVAGGSDVLSYQWYKNNQPLPLAGQTNIINGGTNSTLVINPLLPSDASSDYYVVVTNSSGAVTSAVAALGVFSSPIITSQLPTPYTNEMVLLAGASPSFSVTVSGASPLRYQWYNNNTAVAGATNASFVLANVQPGLLTNYCIITNFLGSATSFVWLASIVAPSAPFPQAVLALNPRGYWRLNEPDDALGDGNPGAIAYDYAGGNNGIYTNLNLGLAGYSSTDPESSALVGTFLSHDSDANSIQGIDFSAPTNTSVGFTVQAWAKGTAAVNNPAGIASKGYFNNEEFSLDTGTSTHAYRFEVRDAKGAVYNANSTVLPNDSIWHLLVGVCDQANSNLLFYIDGRVAASATILPGSGIFAANSTVPMIIGSRPSDATTGANNQFFGYINDVAAFNYPLTANQVLTEYLASGVAPFVVSEPPADTAVSEGGTLTISANVLGTAPLSYQWVDSFSSPLFASQTNATLVISNIPAALNGDSIYLAVTNLFGSTNTTSVALTVSSGAPVIFSDVSPVLKYVYAGTPVIYSFSANGTLPIFYQWYQDGTIISGATNSTFSLDALLGTNTYSCTASNNYNGGSVTPSRTVTLVGVSGSSHLYPLVVQSDSPVAYWRLNEPDNGQNNGNAGVIAHDNVGGHNAFYTNTVLGLPGYNASDPDTVPGFGSLAPSYCFAEELDLSGSGTPNIDFSQPLGGNAEFSVEAWVNGATGQTLNNRIVTKGHFFGEQFGLDLGTTSPTTAFRFFLRNASAAQFDARSTLVPDAKWHHLVGVCDQSNSIITLYIDGAVAVTNTFAAGAGLNTSTETVTIGNGDTDSGGGGLYTAQFLGSVGDVSLYNYPLSASQVSTHYQAGVTLSPVEKLSISRAAASQVQLNWNYGTLQVATNVLGPYSAVQGAAAPSYTVPATNTHQFYRVKIQ